MDTIPFVIIGSGICGVLTALKLRAQFPEDIAILDKEPYPGHHNTTRNSGVLHAGIYYETGSLKHKLCIDGHRQWLEISKQYDIPLLLCGKYIIATTPAELETLESYCQNAIRNGVRDIRRMTPEDFKEIQDYTTVIDGFFSPHTGILDISTGINTLYNAIGSQGVMSILNTEVLEISPREGKIYVRTHDAEFLAENVINCAGAGAVSLRKMLGLQDIEDRFVKGNYLKLNKPFYNDKLIYPVPLKNLKGLGVHTSFHIDKIIRFGPNTEDVESVDYVNRDENLEIMYPAIHEKFKNIEKKDLSLDYAGVRTKITKDGVLYPDFLIQGPEETKIPGYFEALGIESPGMTAAPAIADVLVSKIQGFLKKTR